ncbi:hypothetical protein Ade02nite_86140 [Paractinoplanes deccanensis]|uniref:Uncharacterized protein n=1 Tax=Paractinoplanes deccanensis TaxID=113561 RepID=A0ABQ3YIY1_9ACTN|nr:hypothetical protein Ade02nite_86140 [Actinoplanes deccanensis]
MTTTSVSSGSVQRGIEAGSSNAYSATAHCPFHSTRSVALCIDSRSDDPAGAALVGAGPRSAPADAKYLSGMRGFPPVRATPPHAAVTDYSGVPVAKQVGKRESHRIS